MYPEYEKIFPEIERKSYTNFKKSYDKNIVDMKAIKLLKEMYQNYDGIYIEIEKVGNGDN